MNFWQGEKARLRAIEARDWEAFHHNDEDTEEARLCDEITFPRSPDGTRRWAEETAKAPASGDVYRWAIENAAGELVGTLNTHGCERRCGTFSYGVAIFRPHWRKGYAAEAIRIVLRYYFEELRYQKCTVSVYAFNQASLQLHARLGFQVEGRLRRMIYTGGAYHDEFRLGITAEEFASTSTSTST
jgi:RimJ/RimL family protein N-acetyltransferase